LLRYNETCETTLEETMPSPFPGMNPFLEQDNVWHDFHESFMPTVREMLAPQVRPQFMVKIDEHIYIHELPVDERRLAGRGDVTLAENRPGSGSFSPTATLIGPTEVQLPKIDVERLSFLEIRDRDSGRVIAVIELLSPANKNPGPDRDQYLAKRAHLLNSAVHLVEIDLLRGGPRMPMTPSPQCDYCVLRSPWQDRPRAGLWPIHLRQRLPVIPVPLQDPHPDAELDLQQVLHRIYDAAGYEDYIYRGSPQPRLRPEDVEWSRQFMCAVQDR
jgi:hypothetical protein